MQMDFASHHKVVMGFKADNYGTGIDQDSSAIDTAGFAEAIVIFNAGTVGASGTVDLKVRDSADNSTYADLTGAAFTQITGTNDDTVYVGRIRLNSATAGTTDKCNRYLKLRYTVGTAACDFGVTVLLLNATGTGVTLNTMSFSID
jgi:hypothetical protein